MFIPTKSTVKLANENVGYAQGIGIILCCFPNCPIIYPVVTVYCFPGHPSNTILWGDLKCYVGSKNIASKPLEHCGFLPLMLFLEITLPDLKNLDYLQIKIIEFKPFKMGILWYQLSMAYQNIIYLGSLVIALVLSLLPG